MRFSIGPPYLSLRWLVYGDHIHEYHAVLYRTAVLVLAVVGVRGQELRDEVAVAGMNLDGVESSVTCDAYCIAEILDDLMYLILSQTMNESRRIEIESAGCSYGPLSAVHPVRHVAAVSELYAGLGSCRMYGVCQVSQARDDLRTHP